MSLGLLLLLINLQKFIHELGHFLIAKRLGIVVEEFGIGYPPRYSKLGQRKGTIFTFNWFLVGSFIKMLGENDASIPGGFASKSKLSRLSILIVGPILNLIAMCVFVAPAIVFFTLSYMAGVSEPITGININGEEASVAITVISEVMLDSPAEEAGLQSGDTVAGADETKFRHVDDLVTYVETMKGREIVLHIERENQLINVPIVPRVNPPGNQGAMGIGIIYEGVENETIYYPPPVAFVKGVVTATEHSWRTIYMPFVHFRNRFLKDEGEATGPRDWDSLILLPMTEERTRLFPIFWFLGVVFSVGAIIPIVLITAISLLPLPGWDNWRIIALIFGK